MSRELIGELKLLQTVFENSPAAILVVDKTTSIQLVNSELEIITGYGREELEGVRRWKEFVLAEDQDILKNLLRVLKTGGTELQKGVECRFVDKSGNLKIAYLSGYYSQETGYIILSLINITDQKQNESQLKSAKSKAEAADRLKTAFLANLSHEIRTPMNAIVGFASLLQMDELTEHKKRLYLTQIVNGSSDLLELIEKTITISKIDLGQIKINKRQFFVNKRLKEIKEKYEHILETSGKGTIDLILEPGNSEEEFVVQADSIHIMEVLNNLLENAVKFTQDGRITIGYSYLEEETENEFDSLLFFVKDTGCGVSEEKSKIIFDRFVKLVDKNETVLRGAGLGLAISHDLVKLMGGDIWLETAPGKGSKFFFTIPLSYTRGQQETETDSVTKKIYDDWSSYEVLVAEDLESNYLYIKELLAPSRITILRARDGLEAVEIFQNHPEIDLVLMDILMPGLDGYEATAKLREMRNTIPVIAQTAFTFEGEIQDGLYAGCFNDYIMKPFTRDMLVANMKKYLPSK